MMEWGQLGEPQKGAGDQIIYYRRPRKGENAGWITWGDSVSGSKLRDYVRRGFEPLMQYGTINSAHRNASAFGTKSSPAQSGWSNERYIWEQILTAEGGPEEFPVAQIIAFRWYRPENCPVPDAVFPQLRGVKIKEYRCPECRRAPFVDVDGAGGVTGLANHLRITHDWDRVSLNAYGDRVGIDFNRVDVVDAPVTEYEANTAERPRQRAPRRESIAEVETVG